MSDPTDKELDDYLGRDSNVSQRYRALATDDVPETLDAAILTQARAAVATPVQHSTSVQYTTRRKSKWLRWSAPLALAAAAVMVVAIVLEIGVQDEVSLRYSQQERMASAGAPLTDAANSAAAATDSLAVEEVMQPRLDEAPAPAAVPPQIASERREFAAESRKAAANEQLAVTAQERQRGAEVQQAPAAVAALEALPQAGFTNARSLPPAAEVAGNAGAQDETEEFARSTTPSAKAPPASEGASVLSRSLANENADLRQPHVAPDEWLRRIRQLRNDGKGLEADEQWQRFVAAYPNFPVIPGDSARPTSSQDGR